MFGRIRLIWGNTRFLEDVVKMHEFLPDFYVKSCLNTKRIPNFLKTRYNIFNTAELREQFGMDRGDTKFV